MNIARTIARSSTKSPPPGGYRSISYKRAADPGYEVQRSLEQYNTENARIFSIFTRKQGRYWAVVRSRAAGPSGPGLPICCRYACGNYLTVAKEACPPRET